MILDTDIYDNAMYGWLSDLAVALRAFKEHPCQRTHNAVHDIVRDRLEQFSEPYIAPGDCIIGFCKPSRRRTRITLYRESLDTNDLWNGAINAPARDRFRWIDSFYGVRLDTIYYKFTNEQFDILKTMLPNE